jgi:hypothetical protein
MLPMLVTNPSLYKTRLSPVTQSYNVAFSTVLAQAGCDLLNTQASRSSRFDGLMIVVTLNREGWGVRVRLLI